MCLGQEFGKHSNDASQRTCVSFNCLLVLWICLQRWSISHKIFILLLFKISFSIIGPLFSMFSLAVWDCTLPQAAMGVLSKQRDLVPRVQSQCNANPPSHFGILSVVMLVFFLGFTVQPDATTKFSPQLSRLCLICKCHWRIALFVHWSITAEPNC